MFKGRVKNYDGVDGNMWWPCFGDQNLPLHTLDPGFKSHERAMREP